MTKRSIRRVMRCGVAVILVLASVRSEVFADCRGPREGELCPAFGGAHLIVLADVLDVDQAAPGRVSVGFRVLELFKGQVKAEATLVFQLTAESFRFVPGQRLLLYTKSREGVWSSSCTRIRTASTEDEEVKALRSLASGQKGALVEGSVWNPGRGNERQPAGGLEVSLDRGGVSVVRRVTDPSGAFMLGWVVPGRYVLRISGDKFRPQLLDVVIGDGEACHIVPTIRLVAR